MNLRISVDKDSKLGRGLQLFVGGIIDGCVVLLYINLKYLSGHFLGGAKL